MARPRALFWVLLLFLLVLTLLYGRRAFLSAQVILQRFDLSVSQEGPEEVAPGGTAIYAILVRNGGPDAAAGVVLSDVVPPGLRFDAGQSDPSCVVSEGIVFCGNGRDGKGFALGNGEEREFAVAFTVPAAAGCRITLANTVLVQGERGHDGDEGNNRSAVTTAVACVRR